MLHDLSELFALPPARFFTACAFVAGFMVLCELVRIALMTQLTRSVLAHVTLALLTFPIQSIFLAWVLCHAAHRYPHRAWLNLGVAAGAYVVWYLAGQATLLVRRDSQGADPGFMFFGGVITFVTGFIAAVAA